MKVFSHFTLGLTLAFALCTTRADAANYTRDLNGWGYVDIREATLLPVIVPLGIAAIMITVAYLCDESSSHNHHCHTH